MSSTAETPVVVVDSLMARSLELEGLLCFHCPLLEDPRFGPGGAGECRVRYRDLAPVLGNPRAGIRAVVVNGQIPAYAVFGPPAAFRNAPDLPFELDDDALLVAALHAIPEARAENTDIDLLIEVVEFARAKGFSRVQALCRDTPGAGPEARTEIVTAAGFEVTEPEAGLRLGTIEVADWFAGRGDAAGEQRYEGPHRGNQA
ncbi:MAG: hypothetical protein R6X12_08940 [bacterium]